MEPIGSNADPLEARREQALINSTAARLLITRHKAQRLREALVERDRSQSNVTAAAAAVIEQLTGAALEEAILEAIGADLGDIENESLRVTR